MAGLLSGMTQSVLTDRLGRIRMDGFGLTNTIIRYIQTGMAQILTYQTKKKNNQTKYWKEMEGTRLEQILSKRRFKSLQVVSYLLVNVILH